MKCFLCVENEDAEGLSQETTAVFLRGFFIGKTYAEAGEEGRTRLKRSMCLRHCHELVAWEAYYDRNIGKEPGTWEREPPTSGSRRAR